MDDYTLLSDKELDRKIAQTLGFKVVERETYFGLVDSNGDEYGHQWNTSADSAWENCPHYATSLLGAWDLIRRLPIELRPHILEQLGALNAKEAAQRISELFLEWSQWSPVLVHELLHGRDVNWIYQNIEPPTMFLDAAARLVSDALKEMK